MLPVIPLPGITPRQKAAAVMVAGVADMLQIGLFPIFGIGYLLDDAIDVITAIALTAICGFKWQFVLAFMMELVPFVDILPTWTAVALLLSTHKEDGAQSRVNVQVVNREGMDMLDTQAISVPPGESRRQCERESGPCS